MKKSIYLSVIIPCYNEEKNFEKGSLDKVKVYLKDKFNKTFEVIIVDDGSTDKTAELVASYIKDKDSYFLLKKSHQGKALTVAAGVLEAKGKYILFTDFDQATPLAEIEKLMPFVKKGYDIVIGSREVKGARREKEPFYRHLMGKVFNLVVQIVVLPGIHDTQCGFKLFENKVAKKLFSQLKVSHIQTDRAFTGAFDVELLFLAQKLKFKIAEVPVFWQHYETKRVNPFYDSIKMFFDVLKIRLNDILGKYDNKK
ncbi:dolichyl-phosphate beta-glucosyltransferase [Patescibacteria group bacterium]